MRERLALTAAVLFLLSRPVFAGGKAEALPGDILKAYAGGMMAFQEPEEVQLISEEEMNGMYGMMEAYQAPEETLVLNRGSYFHYYEQIDPVAREMYDIMLEVARDPETEGNYGLMMTTLDPTGEEFARAWVMAYTALIYDHPELFWLYTFENSIVPYSDGMYANGIYYVLFALLLPYEGYREEMTAFNEAAGELLSLVDRSASDYDQALQVHDLLSDLATYDKETGVYQTLDDPYAHTAYSILVRNSRGIPNTGVCDGYALAYEYILQQLGIPAAFNGGMAGSLEDEAAGNLGGHAWNEVMLDGKWYEADCTWDDNLSEIFQEQLPSLKESLDPGSPADDFFLEMLNDEAYLNRLSHYLFMISTEEMTRYIVSEHPELYYVSGDGQFSFSLLEGEDRVHLRLDPIEDGLEGELLNMAPVSYGA